MRFFILFFLAVNLNVAAQNNSIRINIDNPKFRPMIIGVTPMSKSPLGIKLSSRLEYLLNFSGVFKTVQPRIFDSLLGTKVYSYANKGGVSGFDFQAWKKLGLEAMIVASLEEGKSKSKISLHAIDLFGMKSIVDKTYSGVSNQKLDVAIRHFADTLLQKLTNKSGIFNSKIVFVGKKSKSSKKHIYLADFDGSNVEQITHENTIHISPHLSRDGNYLTYTSFKLKKPSLYVYNIKTKRHKLLSSSFDTNSGGAFSPNSKSIVFTAASKGNSDLYVVPVSGGRIKGFIKGNGDDVDAAISHSGTHMAYVSGRYGNPHIFSAQLNWLPDGTPKVVSEKRLTYAGWYNTGPSWSPNNSKIAFAGYDKDINRYDIFVMNSNGSKMERLTLRIADNEDPSWSPNGQLILFQTNRIGKYNSKGGYSIYLMNQDGSNQRKLNTGMFEAYQPEWGINQKYPF